MKIYVNRKPVDAPWGGGAHFFRAFHQYVPEYGHTLVESLFDQPDVIVLASIESDGFGVSADQAIIYKRMSLIKQNRDVKVILRVNENDARKGTAHVDAAWMRAMNHVDCVVFVSNWLKTYYCNAGWIDRNSTVIVNGVDRSVFRPRPKLNNGKLNIVAHHWSNHAKKGFDVYDQIDRFVGDNPNRFTFTYIGRDRQTFLHTNVVKPLHGLKLGEELSKYDVYVSASRFDPGPNHCSEPICCGLPTYVHVDGGGAVEFAGEDHSYRDWDELRTLLEHGKFTPNVDFFTDWRSCIEKFVVLASR